MQTIRKNVVQVKKFRDNYKITVCNVLISGNQETKTIKRQRGKANNRKLDNNISRAKKQILEKALCNDWDFFCTLTLSPKRYQRDDLKKFIKDLGQLIRDSRKKYQADIQYLLIPELHADGKNWHMHGLLKGLPFDCIGIPENREMSEKGYFIWEDYNAKFGYCSIGAIKDQMRVSMYITKYITKDLSKAVTGLNSKLYYCSRGLKTAEVVSEGQLYHPVPFEMAYQGQFSKSQFVDDYTFFKQFYKECET